jgi:pilus assembly protein Flp/PilA
MTEIIRSMWMNDEGQDLVEYALLIALIAIVVVAALIPLGTKISSVFSRIDDCLSTPTGC